MIFLSLERVGNKLTGYEKLKATVEKECNERNSCGCFNQNGCDKPNGRFEGKSCFHQYCDQFKWVINRAKHYEEKTGIPWNEILDSWEEKRNYWYMNYYQDCNQPEIKGDKVRVFETVKDMMDSLVEKKFRCPSCGGISASPYRCNSGNLVNKNTGVCDWNVGGLFGDLGKGIFVFCKDKVAGETIFMPIAWEVTQ